MKVLMHALAVSCKELRARTGNPLKVGNNISTDEYTTSAKRKTLRTRKQT